MSDRNRVSPIYRRPVPGETPSARYARQFANRQDREAWHRYTDARCAECGKVRFHVTHEMDPEHSPEGGEYHRDIEHHAFVGVSRGAADAMNERLG